ncbi:TMV resistance protein N [Trifolium repens]|nr:TMV resistance protein N [Trifolium repens]
MAKGLEMIVKRFGIDSRINMCSLLKTGSYEIHFSGIWGIGGIGKTTLAILVYKKIHNQFNFSCFLENVRDFYSRDGLLSLLRKSLCHLNISNMRVETLDQGKETQNLLFNNQLAPPHNTAPNSKNENKESRQHQHTSEENNLRDSKSIHRTYRGPPLAEINSTSKKQLLCYQLSRPD